MCPSAVSRGLELGDEADANCANVEKSGRRVVSFEEDFEKTLKTDE